MTFPILKRKVHEKNLVYFDNAATTQKPQVVLDAIQNYYAQHNANVHRGIHTLADEATTLYENARKTIAQFVNVEPKQIVFASGTTDSINLVANWARENLQSGDEILLSIMEHHANIVPWQEVAKKTGAKLVYVNLIDDYELDMQDFAKKLSSKTKLVAITHASNVLGTVTPVQEIVQQAHAVGARVLVDGAQAVGHFVVDVMALGVDWYAFSGHKMYGPMGIGVLVLSKDVSSLPPTRFGGEMIEEVTKEKSTFTEAPHRFEAGTPNVAGAIGLAAAAKYVTQHRNPVQEQELVAYAWEKLASMPEITLYGPTPKKNRVPIISFTVKDIHAHDVAQVLDEHGVAIRSGVHCAMPLHTELGVVALNRASFANYNTKEEVDVFISALNQAIKLFGDRNE